MSRAKVDVPALVAILKDEHARWDERDDAASYLAQSDDPVAVAALAELIPWLRRTRPELLPADLDHW